ncbi:MAG: TrmB family transcriptional regulator [Methanomicrobiaceae archaeon]|nr:TrmB family transcriptional regulator [Methanomicrobiaceae archaeon]
MTKEIIPRLRALGLNEYETKVYSTLVGLRKATARDIHEVSGVPRGRIYEILHDLVQRGFIGMEEGSPNAYYRLDTDQVIDRLKADTIDALEETRTALKSLEMEPLRNPTPWFALKSDWAIENHFQAIFRKVQNDLVVICNDPDFLRTHQIPFTKLRRRINLYVVVLDRKPFAGITLPLYEARGVLRELLVNPGPEGEDTDMVCSFFLDEKEIFVIGNRGNERFAFIGTTTPLVRYLSRSIIEHLEE